MSDKHREPAIHGREHIRILHAAQRLIHRPHQLPHQVRRGYLREGWEAGVQLHVHHVQLYHIVQATRRNCPPPHALRPQVVAQSLSGIPWAYSSSNVSARARLCPGGARQGLRPEP